jgi:hypothetical protein
MFLLTEEGIPVSVFVIVNSDDDGSETKKTLVLLSSHLMLECQAHYNSHLLVRGLKKL